MGFLYPRGVAAASNSGPRMEREMGRFFGKSFLVTRYCDCMHLTTCIT
jgi:hypothetical protein